MRGATGDVAAAERQLNAIEDLLSRSCRAAVGSGLALTAASASTRPPNVRGASLLLSRKALSNPSVHRARSRGASVLRTHAPAAALHARRSTPKGVSRRYFACSSSPARWPSCSAGCTRRRCGPLGCESRQAPPPPPARPSPLPLLRPPPRLRRRRPAARTCACALPLAQRRSASTRRTPEPPRRLPPPRARPRRKGAKPGAVAAALAAAATPQAHTTTSEAAPDRRAAPPRSPTPPPPPPTSPPSASWPALPTRTGLGPETNIPAWGRECRPPQG